MSIGLHDRIAYHDKTLSDAIHRVPTDNEKISPKILYEHTISCKPSHLFRKEQGYVLTQLHSHAMLQPIHSIRKTFATLKGCDMRKQKSSQSRSYQPNNQHRERSRNQASTNSNLSAGSRQSRTQRHRYKRGSLRAGLAVLSGRAVGAVSRRLHLGGGTSIVGVVAQRLYPDIVEHLAAQLEYGSIIVSGTNGKTTTSGFISAIMSDAGIRVWRNREGSNLMRGVASSLVIRALPNGQLRRAGKAISVLEIDEAVLPQITQIIAPRVLVLTNLFRDQLDRYGEVDSVLSYWKQAISNLPTETTLVLNADDPAIAALGESYAGKVLYYGIEDISLDITNTQNNKRHQVIDTRTCPRCGSDYQYDVRFYSHMGHYHCPNGDTQRPRPDVRAIQVQVDDFDRLRTIIELNNVQQAVVVPLPGLYNVYNALAAATATHALNVGWGPIVSGIEQSKPAFGRGERIQADGRTIRLLLAKNPTGFNEVLRTVFSDGSARHILFVLNDNIADGRDISWIWDVDFERARGLMSTLVIAGTRARDLALRLKLAGITSDEMLILPPTPLRVTQRDDVGSRRSRRSTVASKALKDEATTAITPPSENYIPVARSYGLKKALDTALEKTPRGETLFIVPTYTGLLEVHHELEQRGLAAHYWEGETV